MRLVATILLFIATIGFPAAGQAPDAAGGRKAFSIDDYARWRVIDNARLSPDGQWAAYGLQFANVAKIDARPVLHLRRLATGEESEIADASDATFSPDSRWLAYRVEPRPPARGRHGGGAAGAGADSSQSPAPDSSGGRAAAPPPHTPPSRYELRELATGRTQSWQEIESAVFSPDSGFLLLRRRPPAPSNGGSNGAAPGGSGAGGAAGRGRGAGAPTAAHGTDAILVDLASGRSRFLGSVGEAAFNRAGDALAYTVDAAIADGNGLFVSDLKSGSTAVLDNDSLHYSRLTWNDRGDGIAVLKGHEVEKRRERQNRLLVFPDLHAEDPAPVTLDIDAAGFPAGYELSDRAPITWSDDGREVFVGIIPQTPAADTARHHSADSVADVDVWRTQDERIQSVQMVEAETDLDRTFREGFVIAAAKYVPLSDSSMRELDLPATGHWAVGRNSLPYVSDYKPSAADFYRVNTATGERLKMLSGQLTGPHVAGISPDDRGFLYWKAGAWQWYDFDAATSHALTAAHQSFDNVEWDYTTPRPPYPVAGFASDGSGVIAEQQFDLWLLPFDSTRTATNLTNGAGARDRIVYRYVRTEPIDSSMQRAARAEREIDLSKPVVLSAYGEDTKKAGFARLADGRLQSLLFDDAAYSTPMRAEHGDRYLFTRQTFSEFPDLVVSGGDFATRQKISDANPEQREYLWGHRVLFDFTTRRGDKLQGILAVPDDYRTGEKRPMLVTFYEKNSQTLNRYPVPSYLSGMGTMPIEAVSRGYITMIPDVKFHTGTSHSDMLDAVEAATRKVIAMGYADPARIGLHGHSYGGEGAAFIATRSRLFAAVGVGAGVTDLYTDFSQSWGWSYQVTGGSGENGSQYYLNGQGRWGFSPWDKPDVYHSESALTHVPEVTEPILIMHGTADPTVSFSEGMNFYNALRFNGKNAVLLAYLNEGHGLRGVANRRDLTIRFFQFFDHYLKGAPEPRWMSAGVTYIRRDLEKGPE
ncbi:MAG: prolyl oligopeptidase family serine peptidase [Gemmatimonadales bacterium]